MSSAKRWSRPKDDAPGERSNRLRSAGREDPAKTGMGMTGNEVLGFLAGPSGLYLIRKPISASLFPLFGDSFFQRATYMCLVPSFPSPLPGRFIRHAPRNRFAEEIWWNSSSGFMTFKMRNVEQRALFHVKQLYTDGQKCVHSLIERALVFLSVRNCLHDPLFVACNKKLFWYICDPFNKRAFQFR